VPTKCQSGNALIGSRTGCVVGVDGEGDQALPLVGVNRVHRGWSGGATRTVAGSARMTGFHHVDTRFPGVDPVSGVVADWVSTVCQPIGSPWYARLLPGGRPPVYFVANRRFTVPAAISSALCRSRGVDPAAEPNLLIARYPAEDPMQADLARNGVNWYCFGVDRDALTVFATTADEQTTSATGWMVSPVLEPLEKHFGFNVYSNPGH
jgi:hypothetical protein